MQHVTLEEYEAAKAEILLGVQYKEDSTLEAFSASLPRIDGPWDEAFHERVCNYCPAKNCDNGPYRCPT